MRYKISVKTIQGIFLTFTVGKYEQDGNFIKFLDEKTNIVKRFYVGDCEIQEEDENG